MQKCVRQLMVALWLAPDGDLSPRLVALSTGTLLAGHGTFLVSNKSRFNANEPWGMLSAFSPPIHPALLRYPFSDVIKAHIDPLLAVRISEYLRTVESEIKPGKSMTELQETFAFILNQTDEIQDLILRVQTPDFRPNDCEYRLKVEPHKSISFDGILSPKITDTLPNLLNSTRIIWQSLLPSSTGESTVTIRLEDLDGNLISGRVLTVQIRNDLFTRLRMTTGALFILGAIIAIISPLLPFIGSVLGL